MRALLAFGVILAALAPFGARAASCPVPYTFTYGTPADASQVNANFMALQTCIAAGGGGAPPGGGLYSTQYNLNTMFGGSGPGLAGQVLTSNGPSLPPSFQAPGAASVSITGGDSSIVASPSPITGTGTITVGGPSHLTTFSAGTLPMGAGASPLTASEITDVGLSGVVVGSPTGGAMGAGTINMTGCFVNGSSCAGSGSTTITLGVGLSNAASGSYNTGAQTVTNASTIYPQLYYVAHSTSYTVAATDGAALATFTASGQTATLPAVGAVGSSGFVFGYDGTHSYTVSGTGIYGACGSPPYAFPTKFVSDGTNWQCIPSGAGGSGGGGVNAGTTPQITYYAASGSTVSGDAHLSDQFASTGTLEYNLNSGAIPVQANGIHITGPAAASARYSADAYGGSMVSVGVRSDGTQASPTAVAGTEPLSSLQASAYDGTTTHIGTPQIEFNLSTSTSTQSTGNHGSQFDWYTTPDGTTTLTHQFTMGSDGGLFNPTATGGDKGVGTINLASGCFVNGTSCSGTAAFSALTGGTNTAAAMVVGSGATLAASGSGTITATTVPLAGITGLGTGVATALGDNVGSAGAFVVNGGALGTPSSGTLTNATGLPTAGLLNSAVTYAKIQNETASTLLGNPTGSAAAPSEITLGTNLSFSGGVLNAAGGGSGTPVFFAGPTTAGSANTYTQATTTPTGYTLTNGNVVRTAINATNTAASTLNVNTTGAEPIEKQLSTGIVALTGGELSANHVYDFTDNTTCTCYIVTNTDGSGVTSGFTSATITQPQWANWFVASVTTASQTVTLPSAATLANNGGIFVQAIGNSVTLTPQSADAINGGTLGASVTLASGGTYLVTTSHTAGATAFSESGSGGGGSSGANPTATAGPTAINGSATTFMRSDAAPAVQAGSASQEGILQCGSGTTCSAGTISVSGGGSAIDGPGFVVGDWYLGKEAGASLITGNTMVAGSIYCFPGKIMETATIEALATRILTPSSGGNAQLAVYAPGAWGRPGTLIINSGSLDTTSAGNVSGSVTHTQLTAGWVWFCGQVDNTTVELLSQTGGTSALAGSMLIGNSSVAFITNPQSSGIVTTGAFSTWPNFTSGTTWTDTAPNAQVPVVGFQIVSVP